MMMLRSFSRFYSGLLPQPQRCCHHVLFSNRSIAKLAPWRSEVIKRPTHYCARLTQCNGQGVPVLKQRASSFMSYCKDFHPKQFGNLLSFKFPVLLRNYALNYSTTPFNINRNISQKTLIFSHNNDNFFNFLSIFGVIQMFMWGYLSIFSVQELRSGPVIKKDTANLPWWQRVLYTEGRYKNAISILCFFVGASIFFITLTYPRRAVKKLWLLKGGKDIEITSYSWFGQTHTFKTPVDHINCLQSRTASGNQIPLKLKDKYFFFLLDKKGSFHNPELFDFVIGLQRSLK